MVQARNSLSVLLLLLSSFLSSAVAKEPNVNTRASQCPFDRTVTGYTSIADINEDQVEELERIISGEVEPRPPYSFVLCPNTIFDASTTTLDILLSGTVISCGDDMKPTSTKRCTIRGGISQVYMSDLATPNYDLQRATMIGVTFEKFNGTALDIKATERMTLTLMDVVWKDFYSDFVIAQQRDSEGSLPARVDIIGGALHNGFGGSLFSNDGGVLAMDQLSVSNVTCAGLVSVSNGGVAMVQSSTVTRSVIDTVGSASVGSTLSLFNVEVFEMVYTYRAFYVQNAGSTLLLNRTKIRDMSQANLWNGVIAEDAATAIIDRTEFTSNRKFENLVHARASASVDIIDSTFDSNVGRNPESVSNAIFALMNAVVNLRRSRFAENKKLTSIVFSYMRSTVIMEQSCFFGGSAEQVAFASSDSAVLPVQNFIADTVRTATCPGGGIRLAVEAMGSACYQEGGSCQKNCGLLADQGSCVANTVRLSPLGKNGTDANMTAGDSSTDGSGGMTMMTMPPDGADSADSGNETDTDSSSDGNSTDDGGSRNDLTIAPTEDGTEDEPMESTVRIYVAWLVRNNMDIVDPQVILESGLADAFSLFVERLVETLTATGSRQLMELLHRRLEVSLIEDSAVVYEVIRTGCVYENRTTNMTDTEYTTCHEAMGRYDLMLTSDEDPTAIRATYEAATRSGIDDGTFQNVLLELEPDTPLLLGPSIDARPPPETPMPMMEGAPTPTIPSGPPTTLFPTITGPDCPPVVGGRSKSRSKSKAKGSKGSKGVSKGKKGAKKMRRHSKGYRRARRNLIHPDSEESSDGPVLNFAQVLKDHDEGEYYSLNEHEEEETWIEADEDGEDEDIEVDIELDEEVEVVSDECEEPGYGARSKGSKKSGKKGSDKAKKGGAKVSKEQKGQYYGTEVHHHHEHHEHPHMHAGGHKEHTHDRKLNHNDEERHLRDDLPRIHGTHHHKRISDLHAEVAAELKTDNLPDQKEDSAL